MSHKLTYNEARFTDEGQTILGHRCDVTYLLNGSVVYRASMPMGEAMNLMDKTNVKWTFTREDGAQVSVN
jgi:hypothetical protein